jgi:hypothetical protein
LCVSKIKNYLNKDTRDSVVNSHDRLISTSLTNTATKFQDGSFLTTNSSFGDLLILYTILFQTLEVQSAAIDPNISISLSNSLGTLSDESKSSANQRI